MKSGKSIVKREKMKEITTRNADIKVQENNSRVIKEDYRKPDVPVRNYQKPPTPNKYRNGQNVNHQRPSTPTRNYQRPSTPTRNKPQAPSRSTKSNGLKGG